MTTLDKLAAWKRSGWCGMAILGTAVLLRGLCYTAPVIPEGHRIPPLEAILPLQLWTAVWLCAGILTLIFAAAKRYMAPMVGVCISLHVLWACLYLGAWLTGDSSRGYVTALSYLTIALLALWSFGRGERNEVTVRIRKECT